MEFCHTNPIVTFGDSVDIFCRIKTPEKQYDLERQYNLVMKVVMKVIKVMKRSLRGHN